MTSGENRLWQRSEVIYCSNVHPGESLGDLYNTIQYNITSVRQCRSLDRMGIGLWISQKAAQEITETQESLQKFSTYLTTQGLEILTLNGFPFGNFHSGVVKEKVYLPDWSDARRLDYTIELATILAHCMHDQQDEATISTLPLGYKPNWSAVNHSTALTHLCQLVTELDKIKQQTNRSIRVCLEMEPGCVLEHTDEVIQLFHTELPKMATLHGISTASLEQHLGICFDICHQAVMFEDVHTSLTRLQKAGVPIGKIQISSALAYHPADDKDYSALRRFEEKRYLHQTTTLINNKTYRVMDLNQAFDDIKFQSHTPWRTHFHIPIQIKAINEACLQTTQDTILSTLDYLQQNKHFHPCLEVETYTWHVLPKELRPETAEELACSISNELAWLENALQERHLLAGSE